MNLNKEQSSAVTSPARYLRIFAGAGSGKTEVMARRIDRMVKHNKVSPRTMVAISFTRKASKNLKDRVAKYLPEQTMRQIYFGTAHSFALNIVQHWGELLGYKPPVSVYDEYDCIDIIALLSKQYVVKADRTDPTMANLFSAYLKENNAISYDGILSAAVALLHRREVMQYCHNMHRCIFYDEFQDVSAEEVEILRLISPEQLTIIGDDDQEIYSFRGASNRWLLNPNNIWDMQPGCIYPAWESVTMGTNYRSVPGIVEAAGRLIVNNQERAPKELQAARDGAGECVHVHQLDMPADIIPIIEAAAKKHKPGDLCILARTNREVQEIYNAWPQNIPVEVVSKLTDPWNMVEARRFIQCLRVAVNPWDNFSMEILTMWADNVLPIRFAELRLQAIREKRPLFHVLINLSGRVLRGAQAAKMCFLNQRDVEQAHQYFAEQFQNTGERVNHEIVGKLLTEWQGRSIESFLEWFGTRHLQDEVTDTPDMVHLMTVHTAKGLEHNCVIVAGLAEECFPLKRQGIESERRLAYVAMTRARDELHLCWPRQRVTFGKVKELCKSRFILEAM